MISFSRRPFLGRCTGDHSCDPGQSRSRIQTQVCTDAVINAFGRLHQLLPLFLIIIDRVRIPQRIHQPGIQAVDHLLFVDVFFFIIILRYDFFQRLQFLHRLFAGQAPCAILAGTGRRTGGFVRDHQIQSDTHIGTTADHGSDQHACQQTKQKMSASFAARPSCRRTRLRRYGRLRLIVRAVHARVPAAWSVIVIIIIVVSVLIQNDSSPSG